MNRIDEIRACLKNWSWRAADIVDFVDLIRKKVPPLLSELEQYKKLEEEGRLVRLPCKVGDNVYWYFLDETGAPDGSGLRKEKVTSFNVGKRGITLVVGLTDTRIGSVEGNELRAIYFSPKEAKQAIAEKKGEK